MIILSKKIFKYIMLVSSMVTVLGLAFVIGILSHSFQHQLMNELKKEAVYISRGVEAAGTDYLEQLNNIDSRVTYVDESGKVLYDNEADVESMGNHGHRKEIREAELNGEGEDERMSSTLSEKTIYYAIRLDNGNVLRVSGTHNFSIYSFFIRYFILCRVHRSHRRCCDTCRSNDSTQYGKQSSVSFFHVFSLLSFF